MSDPGAFATPQAALDVAEDGDEVWVGPGRYPGRIDFLGKDVVLRGAGIGRTQIEPGCGFTSSTGVNLTGSGPQVALEDLTLFADCADSLTDRLEVRAYGPYIPGLRRVAVLVSGGVSVALLPFYGGALDYGSVEDLYVEQLGDSCPSWFHVALQMGSSSISRVVFVSRCHSTFDLPRLGDNESSVSNLLISTKADLGVQLTNRAAVSHMTLAFSPAWNGPQWVSGVGFDESEPMPSLHSSVIAGTTYPAVVLGCTDAEGEWDFRWNDFPPVDSPHPAPMPIYSADCDPIDPECGPCPDALPMEEAGNISLDPMFIHWTRDDNMSDDNFCPAPGSPLIDAGDPNELDPDGTRADIGAFGGPYAFSCEEVLDNDGDGYRPITGDCDDTNADRWPFHEEVPCDGVDQDCDGSDIVDCGDDDSADDDSSDDDSADDDSADDDSAVSSSDDDSAAPPESEPWSFLNSCISACEGEGGAALLLPLLLFARRRYRG